MKTTAVVLAADMTEHEENENEENAVLSMVTEPWWN